jgi:hypothetical protein
MNLKQLTETINKYIDYYPNCQIEPCTLLLDLYNGIEWENVNLFKKDKYIKKKIYIDEKRNYEVVVIFWHKDCKTKIHNHPSRGCIMKVLSGSLLEEKYTNNNIISGKLLSNKTKSSYIHDDICQHRIIAIENSISVHVYSPCNFYD